MWPFWSVPVCFFLLKNTEKNLTYLCFAFVCYECILLYTSWSIFCKYIYIYFHYWLKINKSCKTEPNNQFICCVLYFVVTNCVWPCTLTSLIAPCTSMTTNVKAQDSLTGSFLFFFNIFNKNLHFKWNTCTNNITRNKTAHHKVHREQD